MKYFLLLLLLVLVFPAEARLARSSTVLNHFQKEHPCPANGLTDGPCHGFVKDHILPLCAGGPDAVENLKWSEINYARARDRQEWKLCREMKKRETTVCDVVGEFRLGLLKYDLCKE